MKQLNIVNWIVEFENTENSQVYTIFLFEVVVSIYCKFFLIEFSSLF